MTRQAAPPAQRWLLLFVALLVAPGSDRASLTRTRSASTPRAGRRGRRSPSSSPTSAPAASCSSTATPVAGAEDCDGDDHARLRRSRRRRRRRPRDPGRRDRRRTSDGDPPDADLPGHRWRGDDHRGPDRRPPPSTAPPATTRERGRRARPRSPGAVTTGAAGGALDHHRRPAGATSARRLDDGLAPRRCSPPAARPARSPSCASTCSPTRAKAGAAVSAATLVGLGRHVHRRARPAGDPRRQARRRRPARGGHLGHVRHDHPRGRRRRATTGCPWWRPTTRRSSWPRRVPGGRGRRASILPRRWPGSAAVVLLLLAVVLLSAAAAAATPATDRRCVDDDDRRATTPAGGRAESSTCPTSPRPEPAPDLAAADRGHGRGGRPPTMPVVPLVVASGRDGSYYLLERQNPHAPRRPNGKRGWYRDQRTQPIRGIVGRLVEPHTAGAAASELATGEVPASAHVVVDVDGALDLLPDDVVAVHRPEHDDDVLVMLLAGFGADPATDERHPRPRRRPGRRPRCGSTGSRPAPVTADEFARRRARPPRRRARRPWHRIVPDAWSRRRRRPPSRTHRAAAAVP